MAYGTQVYHWRSYGNWSTSTSGKNFTVTLTVGMQSIAWGYDLGVIANANIDGTTKSVRSDFYAATGATISKNMVTVSKTFTREHSNFNKGLSWSIVNGSGYHNGTSTGSGTVTVPALASHTVTFDDNGGSEGPKSTTKWEFEDLTIPSTIPTRKNYEFLGWSTNSNSASAEYEAGKTYNGTKDENYTLYAVWKLLYVPPSFSNAIALRTDSIVSTTENPNGNYGYASFTWNVDNTVYESNVLNDISCVYYIEDSATPNLLTLTGDTSGVSGTVNSHFQADIDKIYRVVCTISDTQGGSVKIERSVSAANFPIEVANSGRSIGLLHHAPSDGLSLGGITLSDVNDVSGSYPMSTFKSVLDNPTQHNWDNILWSGEIKRGQTITVPNLSKYRMFEFSMSNKDKNYWGVMVWRIHDGPEANDVIIVSSMYHVADSNGDTVVFIRSRFSVSGDKLTWSHGSNLVISKDMNLGTVEVQEARLRRIYGIC